MVFLNKRKEKNKYKKIRPTANFYNLRKKKRIKRILLRLFYLFIFLGILSYVVYFVLFTPYFVINTINIKGNKVVKTDQIDNFIYNFLSKKYIIFNENNIITLNKNKLKRDIILTFPRIKEVKIDKKFPRSLNVLIKEYVPVGILCDKELCYLFDKNGIVFEKSPFILGKTLIYIKKDKVNFTSIPFKELDESTVSFLLNIKTSLEKDVGILIRDISFINRYNDIKIETEEGFYILLNQDQKYQNYTTAISKLIKEKIKKDIKKLEYIDLRIKQRAYFKLKDEVIDKNDTKNEKEI